MENERLEQKLEEKTMEIEESPELLDCALGEWLSDCNQDDYKQWTEALHRLHHLGWSSLIGDELEKAVSYYAKRLALTEIEEENAQAQNDAAYLRSQE